MKSLKIVSENLKQIKDSEECYILGSELETIKKDLEVLLLFKKYIPISYIKKLINENEFSLHNFDWDTKDIEIIVDEIKKLNALKRFLKN